MLMNNKLLLYFNVSMAIVYCLSGLLLMLYGEKIFDIPLWARIGTGCLLILYGMFRFHRCRLLVKNENR